MSLSINRHLPDLINNLIQHHRWKHNIKKVNKEYHENYIYKSIWVLAPVLHKGEANIRLNARNINSKGIYEIEGEYMITNFMKNSQTSAAVPITYFLHNKLYADVLLRKMQKDKMKIERLKTRIDLFNHQLRHYENID